MQVHLGVLRKNEQHEDDMLEILEWLHPYVPGHDEKSDFYILYIRSYGIICMTKAHVETKGHSMLQEIC